MGGASTCGRRFWGHLEMACSQSNFARAAPSGAHAKVTPSHGAEGSAFWARPTESILVALAILGLVLTLVAPRVSSYLSESKVKTAKMQIESFEAALDLYYLDNGAFPDADDGLQALVRKPASAPAWNGPYLRTGSVPDDPWGHPYMYRVPGTRAPYEIASQGPARTGDAPTMITSATR